MNNKRGKKKENSNVDKGKLITLTPKEKLEYELKLQAKHRADIKHGIGHAIPFGVVDHELKKKLREEAQAYKQKDLYRC